VIGHVNRSHVRCLMLEITFILVPDNLASLEEILDPTYFRDVKLIDYAGLFAGLGDDNKGRLCSEPFHGPGVAAKESFDVAFANHSILSESHRQAHSAR
jgi:hypothetical protein